jgi:magnesium transporter
MLYEEAQVEAREISDVSELRGLSGGSQKAWIDVQGLGDEKILREIAAAFELPPLVLEDAVNIPQRAKSDLHDRHHVVVARTLLANEEGRLRAPQVCFVIGPNYLITFQEEFLGLFDPVRTRLRTALGPIRRLGTDYLAYALIDAMIDRYYPVTESLSAEIDDLEEEITNDPNPEILARIHRARRDLTLIRRVGWPQRECIHALLRDPSPFVSDTTRGFLRDTYSHVAQVMEAVDAARELALAVSETYLSNVSHRTNEIMKVLTLMASIFIPLSFIAGVYGMNFENMPELHREWGYPAVVIIMLSVASGMLLFFYRKGWIFGGRSVAKKPG